MMWRWWRTKYNNDYSYTILSLLVIPVNYITTKLCMDTETLWSAPGECVTKQHYYLGHGDGLLFSNAMMRLIPSFSSHTTHCISSHFFYQTIRVKNKVYFINKKSVFMNSSSRRLLNSVNRYSNGLPGFAKKSDQMENFCPN